MDVDAGHGAALGRALPTQVPASGSLSQRLRSFLSFPGTSFVVRGVSPPRDAAQMLLGVDAEVGDGVSLQANARTLLSGNVQEYAGNIALKMGW